MKIKFLGCGSAFGSNYQTSAILTSGSGKRLLIDAGTDIRFSLKDAGLSYKDVDAIFLTHSHADHIGGVEWLGFGRHFDKSDNGLPVLYGTGEFLDGLWEHSLSGGMGMINGKRMDLQDYFQCHRLNNHLPGFIWEEMLFVPIKTRHVVVKNKIFPDCVLPSYGLSILSSELNDTRVFYTGDAQFDDGLIDHYYGKDLIFQDCETAPYYSKVHAHYDELKTLSPEIKSKMWLMHYQDNPKQEAIKDGFKGFVQQGQEFDF